MTSPTGTLVPYPNAPGGVIDYPTPSAWMLQRDADPVSIESSFEGSYVIEFRPFKLSSTTLIPYPNAPGGVIDYPTPMFWSMNGATEVIYASTDPMATAPADTPASTNFEHHIVEPLNYEVRLFDGDEPTGGGKSGGGEVVISDMEGDLDEACLYSWSAQKINIYRGDRRQNFSTWELVAKLRSEGITYDWRYKRVRLRDQQVRLYNLPILAARYGGAGGIDGDEAIKGQARPQSYGYVFNVLPKLIVASLLIYQWHDRKVDSVLAARDGIGALSFVSDHATYDLLAAATLSVGQYATCNALGLVRLGGVLRFGLRIDGRGDADPAYVSSRSQIIRRIVTTRGGLSFAEEEIDDPYFTQLQSDQPYSVGFHYDGRVEPSMGQVLDEIMVGCAGWWTVTIDGKLRVGMLTAPKASADIVIAQHDIAIGGDPVMDRYVMPRSTTRMGYQRNFAPQSPAELGDSAQTGELQRLYGEEWRYFDYIVEATGAQFASARRVAVPGGYTMKEDAEREAERQQAIFGVLRKFWRVLVSADAFSPIVGRTVSFTLDRDRYGFSTKNYVVVGMAATVGRNVVALTLWG